MALHYDSYAGSPSARSQLGCYPLAHLKVLDGEGGVSGQGGGENQGAVAVEVLASDPLRLLRDGAVDGADRTLLGRLGRERGQSSQVFEEDCF